MMIMRLGMEEVVREGREMAGELKLEACPFQAALPLAGLKTRGRDGSRCSTLDDDENAHDDSADKTSKEPAQWCEEILVPLRRAGRDSKELPLGGA